MNIDLDWLHKPTCAALVASRRTLLEALLDHKWQIPAERFARLYWYASNKRTPHV